MAKEINQLLSNNQDRNMMRFKGYQYARVMTWKEVAMQHFNLIAEIKERKPLENIKEVVQKYQKIFDELPEINLSHLRTLTDDTGLLQHAKYTTPNLHHGYCVDDNARGLIATIEYYAIRKDKNALPLIHKYMAFLFYAFFYAFNEENRHFRNFMSFDRRWLELRGSEDSHARALWSLGVAVKNAPDSSIRNIAMRLFIDALPMTEHFTSPRAWAFTVIGLQAYLSVYGGDTAARKMRDDLADKIYQLFKNNVSEDWPWCEETATYANAILPHALIISGQWIPDKSMFETGIKALEWLLKVQTAPDGHLSVIGNDGWLSKDGKHSMFDQQPIEVMCLINACLDVYISTRDKKWFDESERCISWFLGQNDLQTPIYDHKTGGCCDGLESQGVNGNQGAESTLAWLISLIRMYTVVGMQLE